MEGMNQPQHTRNHQPQYDNVSPQPPVRQASQGGGPWYRPTLESKITIVMIIVAALLVVAAIAPSTVTNRSQLAGANFINEDQYQAVFLSNGQVYFGKITDMNSSLVVLTDIFYLQVDQQLQPEQDGAAALDPQVSLAKLGNELHGPEDTMFINAKDVIFWENLKDDGQVVQAIKQYKENGEESLDTATEMDEHDDMPVPPVSETDEE